MKERASWPTKAWEVRAMLDGTKTQTRRVAKLTANGHVKEPGGDRLYVRETWAAPHAYDHLPPRLIPQDARIHYAATEDRGGLLWRQSIHMPRWASRITLEVTGVRVERLQNISEADAKAEGARECDPVSGREVLLAGPSQRGSYVLHYRDLWEQINGPGSWAENPWVWVVEFKRVEMI